MAAHRYWRIRNLCNNAGQTGIGIIQMAESAGGANVCSGGTAIASGSYGGGYSPSSAFDGSTSSNWFQSGAGTDRWIGYDFGAGVERDIVEVRTGPGAEDIGGMPRLFLIESSDDNVTWEYEWLCFYNAWVAQTAVTFVKPSDEAENRYWGLVCVSAQQSNNDTVIAEIEMREVFAGADVTGSGTGAAFPVNGSYPAPQAFDNNPASIYYAGTSGRIPFIYYDFGSGNAKEIVQYQLQASDGGSGNNQRMPKNMWIAWSTDGKSWNRQIMPEQPNWGASEARVFETGKGDPPTYTTPVLRGATGDNTSGAAASAILPAGSAAGDRAYLFTHGFYGSDDTTLPGWTKIADPGGGGGGSPLYGKAYTKVLDSTDIANGAINFYSHGAGGIGWALAVLVGTATHRTVARAAGSVGNSSTMTLQAPYDTQDGDFVLIFAAVRNWAGINSDTGDLQVRVDNNRKLSNNLSTFEATADGAFTVTWSVTWGGNNFRAIIPLIGTEEGPEEPDVTTRRRLIIVN